MVKIGRKRKLWRAAIKESQKRLRSSAPVTKAPTPAPVNKKTSKK